MMDRLQTFVSETLSRPLDSRLMELAALAAQRHQGALAVLAYGSVLRGEDIENTLADFYVIVGGQNGLSQSSLARLFGTLLPPNVYYLEANGLRCKYAVVTRKDFRKWMSPGTANPYFWARFAQPVVLAFATDQSAKDLIIDDLAVALMTANGNALSLNRDGLDRWKALFAETYRTELRPEAASRAANVVEKNAAYYRMISELLPDAKPVPGNWPMRRVQGKMLSVLRLAKAAFTFQGGADYAAWKIERHSGERIEITDWHRRHPFLAGLMMLPRLLRRGALK